MAANTTISTQKVDIEAVYESLIAGINTELAGIDSFVLGKQTIARADLLSRFQARIDAAHAVKTSRAALQKLVADERAADASVKPVRALMKSYLQARYGKASPELQSFGFAQTRAGKATAQVKATAVVKAKATRQARGTKGPKQKKAIKGTPATTATAPASPATATAATTAPASLPAPGAPRT